MKHEIDLFDEKNGLCFTNKKTWVVEQDSRARMTADEERVPRG